MISQKIIKCAYVNFDTWYQSGSWLHMGRDPLNYTKETIVMDQSTTEQIIYYKDS